MKQNEKQNITKRQTVVPPRGPRVQEQLLSEAPFRDDALSAPEGPAAPMDLDHCVVRGQARQEGVEVQRHVAAAVEALIGDCRHHPHVCVDVREQTRQQR